MYVTTDTPRRQSYSGNYWASRIPALWPSAVGFAMRAVRNGCRANNTAALNHELFDVLHRRFPNWQRAARYRIWE